MLEFGNIHMPANPTARPAWDITQESVLEGIAKDLGDEIEKARARLRAQGCTTSRRLRWIGKGRSGRGLSLLRP
jgi:hypothetical protein